MTPIHLVLITEDQLSEVVAKKILAETNKNYRIENVLIWNKDKIKGKIKEINRASKGYAYLVLTDQDSRDRCPPDAVKELPEPVHPNLLYRFAVMEIESWIMAHRTAIAKFLSIPLNRISQNSDAVDRPKECLIDLARKSRSNKIRNTIAPRPNSTSKVGPDYNGQLTDFVMKYWDVKTASQCSPSLKRSFARLKQFTPKIP